MGVPPSHHPFLDGMFPKIKQPAIGVFIHFQETSIYGDVDGHLQMVASPLLHLPEDTCGCDSTSGLPMDDT